MKLSIIWVIAICLTACDKMERSFFETASPASAGTTLRLIQTIPLQSVQGRIDHLSVDLKGQRLFVAALGNNSVEVLDLGAGKWIHSIYDLREPQGALFIPALNKIYVTNGGNGLCQIFDADSFAELGRVELSGDADNIRYDSNSASVVVGYGDGGLSFFDAGSGKAASSIKLDGHPESFQLESSDSRIFVNIPSANRVAVVDSQKQKVITAWPLTEGTDNYPMALDESQHRLFVGFRVPARLNVFDTETGKSVASLASVGDADDIFYDAAHKLIFVIGGEGYIDIFSQQDADHYQLLTRIPTGPGARTGLWVPELNRLYIAAPHRGSQEAEIQIFELQP